MTLITPVGGDGTTQDLLAVAEEQFHRVIEAVSRKLKSMDDLDQGAAKETAALSRELSKALSIAMEERARVEKFRRTQAGVVNDYALDFDSARDEIGRRLARIRDA